MSTAVSRGPRATGEPSASPADPPGVTATGSPRGGAGGTGGGARRRLPRPRAASVAAFVALSVVVALVISLLGTFGGPGWNPPRWTTPAPVTTTDTTIAPALPTTTPPGTYDVDRLHVEVHLEPDVTVEATVRVPIGAPAPVPGLVLMHGTGTSGADAFFDLSEALASAGVASIVTAKRSDNYSAFERDYLGMAADYAKSVDALRATEGVDPALVGLYGESEGAVIAPLLAAADPSLPFLVLSAAPVLPLREQSAFAADNYLRNTHVPRTLTSAIPRVVGGPAPEGMLAYLDVDIRPTLREVTQPVLTVYGTGDTSMPLIQGPAVLEELLPGPQTVRYYADGSHGLRVDGVLIPEFPRDVARWVHLQPTAADAPPAVAGDPPAQFVAAGPVPEPPPWATLTALAVWLAGGLALVLLGMVAGSAAVVNDFRARRRLGVPLRDVPGGGVALRGTGTRLVLATLLLWYLFGFYLTETLNLAVNYRTNDVVVRGGLAVVYAAALLACAALVRHVGVIVRERRRLARVREQDPGGRRTHLAGSPIKITTLVCTTAGALILLLVAAYLGAFPLWR